MIKQTAYFLVFFTAVSSLALYLSLGESAAVSCLFGGSLMLGNLLLLRWAWGWLFAKKSTALVGLIILVKYAALGFVFWRLTAAGLHPLGIIIGISNLLLAILSMTAVKSFAKNPPSTL